MGRHDRYRVSGPHVISESIEGELVMRQSDTGRRATADPEFVSVVIPCRNGERYLGDAIESVLAQTWPRRELIVVDDGSDDGSVEVARRFGDSVRLHRQRTAGAGAARNAGVVLRRRIHTCNLGRISTSHRGDYLKVVRAALGRRRMAAGGGGPSEAAS